MLLEVLLILCHSGIQNNLLLSRKHLFNIFFHSSKEERTQYSMEFAHHLKLPLSVIVIWAQNNFWFYKFNLQKCNFTCDCRVSSSSSFPALLLHFPERSNLDNRQGSHIYVHTHTHTHICSLILHFQFHEGNNQFTSTLIPIYNNKRVHNSTQARPIKYSCIGWRELINNEKQ